MPSNANFPFPPNPTPTQLTVRRELVCLEGELAKDVERRIRVNETVSVPMVAGDGRRFTVSVRNVGTLVWEVTEDGAGTQTGLTTAEALRTVRSLTM